MVVGHIDETGTKQQTRVKSHPTVDILDFSSSVCGNRTLFFNKTLGLSTNTGTLSQNTTLLIQANRLYKLTGNLIEHFW